MSNVGSQPADGGVHAVGHCTAELDRHPADQVGNDVGGRAAVCWSGLVEVVARLALIHVGIDVVVAEDEDTFRIVAVLRRAAEVAQRPGGDLEVASAEACDYRALHLLAVGGAYRRGRLRLDFGLARRGLSGQDEGRRGFDHVGRDAIDRSGDAVDRRQKGFSNLLNHVDADALVLCDNPLDEFSADADGMNISASGGDDPLDSQSHRHSHYAST